jgi:hypothetical protein
VYVAHDPAHAGSISSDTARCMAVR